eukprot:scaffold23310_cov108-Isochrysis_galbana.AAC.4
MDELGRLARRSKGPGAVSESALSGGTAPVWPWRGARCLAPFVPGASCSRASVSSVAQKQAHFPSTWRRGKEGTRGRGKEPTPRVPREVDHCAGAFPHPFRGREESCKHIQAMWGCGANWAPPYNSYSYSHSSETHPGEGRNFETSARDERLEDVGGNEGGREWNIVTCWRDRRRCSQLPMKPHSAVNEGKRRQAGETHGKKGRTARETGATHHAVGP